jgi:hypothetical protein
VASRKKKASFEQRFIQRVYQARLRNPTVHTPGTAASNAEQNPDHLSGQTRVKGNLASGSHIYVFAEGKLKQAYVQSYYSWNAWNYLGSGADGSRDIYKSAPHPEYHFFHTDHRANFFQLYPIAALGQYTDVEARWRQEKDPTLRRHYRYKKEALYPVAILGKTKACVGSNLPYPWQAHHLLPTNVFYKNLTTKEIQIILRSDYDINDGRNLIFLPEKPIDTLVHKLPVHASQHVSYDRKVVSNMGDLKNVLAQVAKKEIEHKDAAAKVEEQLHKLETKMFKYTRGIGATPRPRLN